MKVRYVDTPFFIDVPQITSGDTLERSGTTDLSINPAFFPHAPFDDLLAARLGLRASFQDRPTISYTPQTGSQFIRNVTTPISPSSVLFLVQAGYAADMVLDIAVESINGVKNRASAGGQLRPGDPEFRTLLKLLRRAQLSGTVGLRVEQDKEKKETVVFFFQDQDIDPALAAELAEARKLLRVDPAEREFQVVFGSARAKPNELAILTRSIVGILRELSAFVDVPAEHLAEGRAPSLGELGTPEDPPLTVWSGCKKPKDSFAAVQYRDHGFWIDDRDARSKRTFTFLLGFLALADTAPKEGLPLVTIQAN